MVPHLNGAPTVVISATMVATENATRTGLCVSVFISAPLVWCADGCDQRHHGGNRERNSDWGVCKGFHHAHFLGAATATTSVTTGASR